MAATVPSPPPPQGCHNRQHHNTRLQQHNTALITSPEPQLLSQFRPQLLQQSVQLVDVNTRGQLAHGQTTIKERVEVGCGSRLLVPLLGSTALAVLLRAVHTMYTKRYKVPEQNPADNKLLHAYPA